MQYKNKVVYGGTVLVDMTGVTVDKDHLLSGITALDRSGTEITGECSYDSDTTDATAAVAEILNGKTAYVNKAKVTGTMPNRGKVTGKIKTDSLTYTIPNGYHDGSGTVTIEDTNLIASNIRENITILGVTGTMSSSEGMNAQSKSVTPTASGFTVTADDGYNCLSSVVVAAIPYAETPNAAGGITVTIL